MRHYVYIFLSVVMLVCGCGKAQSRPSTPPKLITTLPAEMLAKANASLPDFAPPCCAAGAACDIIIDARLVRRERLLTVTSGHYSSVADLYVFKVFDCSKGKFPHQQLKAIWITNGDDRIKYSVFQFPTVCRFWLTVKGGEYTVTNVLPSPLKSKAYKNVDDAMTEIVGIREKRVPIEAITYLAGQPESFPKLLAMVENQSDGWRFALMALVKAKYKPATAVLIRQLEKYCDAEKAAGQPVRYGSVSDVVPTGWVLANALGNMGDPAAVPVLKKATGLMYPAEQSSAYRALYKLGGATMDDLFKAAKTNQQVFYVITEITRPKVNSDPSAAVEICGRIIREYPNDKYAVAYAHLMKMQCHDNLGQYRQAVAECDEVLKFTQYPDLVRQAKEARPKLVEQMK